MEQRSSLTLARELETQLSSVLAGINIDALSHQDRRAMHTMKRLATDIRLDVRDAEYAETRAEQARYAAAAKKRTDQLQHAILAASEQNMFSAIEVAELSVLLQQIIAGLA